MQPDRRGFYINLDRSADRRVAMEAQLARAGLGDAYGRFAAVGGEGRPVGCRLLPGQYGCFRSHHDLLAGLPPGAGYVHVLEDDAVLSPAFGQMLGRVIAGGMLAAFDLVFTDIAFGDDLPLIRTFKTLFDRSIDPGGGRSLSLLDLKSTNFSALASYVVTPSGLPRVVAALKHGLTAGPARPVDLVIRDEVLRGRLRAGLLFPFLTTIDGGLGSTIVSGDASKTVGALLRNAFYVDQDMPALRRQMAAVEAADTRPPDAHLDLIGDILRFLASDRFKPF